MTKPDKKKQLEKVCERLWSKSVITRDNACRGCNSQMVMQAHHIRGRQHKATTYDLSNGLTLCRRCHSLQKFRPEKFHDLIIEIIGQMEYDRLKEKSKIIIKFSQQDLIDIRDRLKKESL